MLEKELLTVEEFMDVYSQTRSTTYKEIKKGRLIVKKLGARTFIPKKNADAWMDEIGNIH